MNDVPRPMLASPMEGLSGRMFDAHFAEGWALEEKLDGHRVIVRVQRGEVTAHSRPRSSSAAGKTRDLPPTMVTLLRMLGDGDYDGELVAVGGKSSNVISRDAHLVYVAFDLLAHRGWSLMRESYDERRAKLLDVLRTLPPGQQRVSTVLSQPPTWANVQAIWARGGEGAIVKRRDGRYVPGSRSPEWVKVKQADTATLTVIGFEAGKSGAYSALQLRDDTGHVTTVKTLDNRMRFEIAAAPDTFVGRRVVIEFQEKTAAGCYRHGRFERFEEAR